MKALLVSIRDTLLNSSKGCNQHQFINANSNGGSNSITKNLLEIIELAASDWKFDQSQQIYYFPYTQLD